MLDSLLQDIRNSLRRLLKKPGFSVVAISILALGIGANTAIFSVINAVLLRSLPYNNPEQLVWIWENNLSSNIKREPVSLPDFLDWKQGNQSFQDMAAFAPWLPILTGEGEPERIACGIVSSNFFSVLQSEVVLGRTFLPEEGQRGKNRVVILSYGIWQRRFGSDKHVLEKSITLNGIPHTVVGVMPASFQYPVPDDRNTVELWVPLGYSAEQMPRRLDFLNVIGKLKPGVSPPAAQADLATTAARLEQQYPETNAGWGVDVITLQERFTGDVRPPLILLSIAVGLLLLVACANVANLLLIQSAAREKEVAIRVALGATRRRLAQQLLTESMLLALVASAFAILLAWLGTRLLVAFGPVNVPRITEARLDLRVLCFTLLLSLLTGILFGLVPALRISPGGINQTLRESGRTSGEGASGRFVRGVLAVSEIALVLMLLIGCGLMVKSFIRLQSIAPGFDTERLLTFEMTMPRTRYRQAQQQVSFIRNVLDRIMSLPGIRAAATATTVPFAGQVPITDLNIEGRPTLPSGHVSDAQMQVVSSSYFYTMGISLQRGRLFEERDSEKAEGVVVINEAMAERYWPGEDPLGKRVTLEDLESGDWLRVIGVVGNVRQVGMDSQPYPQLYRVYTQNPRIDLAFMVRTDLDPATVAPAIRGEVLAEDKDQALHNVRTMKEVISDSLSRPRFNTQLMSILTAVSIVLMVVGVYGVVSYSVTQRTHEIGVRMALGADKRDIFKIVAAQALKLALVGTVVGLAFAFALTRLMSSLLFEVSATDRLTFIGVPVMVTVVVLAACYVPARRATKVDPVVALRYE